MQLKSLEIQGFKSFPDKTKLVFGKGITAVVGPNGSGKSNISDAVRWVLGEQSTKTLRGGKMEDVIFGGTKERRPQGVATVSLTIDNVRRELAFDADEITVLRKLYRSGESEYRINGSPVRLKDIHEMFMDTGLGRDGYSMIGQGRIGEIISAKSTQRREIFEEAAGISKYRYRKEEAQKRLEMAQENLLRLKDILSELEERVEPLRIQSEKAQKFLAYAAQKKEIEISLWMENLEQLRRQLREQEDRILTAKGSYGELEKQMEEMENRLLEISAQIQEGAQKVERLREESREAEQKIGANQAEAAVLENDCRHAQEEQIRLEREKEIYLSSQEARQQSLLQLEEKIDGKEKELFALQKEEKKAQKDLQSLKEGEEAILKEIEQTGQRRQAALSLQSDARIRSITSRSFIEETQNRLQSFAEDNAVLDGNIASCQREQQDCEELIAHIDERCGEIRNAASGCRLLLESRSKELEELRRKMTETEKKQSSQLQKARLYEEMEKNHEGFYNSVRFVLKYAARGILQGICGTVADLIQVEERCAQAVETALGGAIQNLIVEREENAQQVIELLKREDAGRVTLLPLTSVKGIPMETGELERCRGFVALACDAAKCAPKYREVICSLLGRVAIVQEMDSAIAIAKKFGYRWKIVTLDGQVIHAGGSFTGGSAAKTVSFLSRRNEIEQLKQGAQKEEEQLTKLHHMEQELQKDLTRLDRELQGYEEDLRVASDDKIRYQAERKRLNISLEDYQRQRESAEQAAREMEGRLKVLEEQNLDAGKILASFDQTLQELKEQETVLQARLVTVTHQGNGASEILHHVQMRLLELRKDLDRLCQDRSRGREEEQQQNRRLEELQQQQQDCQAKMETASHRRIQALEENERLREMVQQLQRDSEQLTAKRLELERNTTLLRKEEREKSAQREQMSQETARLEERRVSLQGDHDRIIAALWDEYELTRTEALRLAKPIEHQNQAQAELSELKQKIRELGSVNLAALEEYQEVSQRYTFLKRQMEDVENSREELKKLIQELTIRMREAFGENFQQINRHFSQIFSDLFGGGTAQLKLTDEQDILESGIEIFVEPPGKIIKNLGLLSGGEQAFVAIAIYFAILKVRPSPFCLLDEIEAALDDVNVNRYAQYLRRLSTKTQFIAITHRRGTMEEADVLYGVTMQEDGVSKLLELNVAEAERRLLGAGSQST